MESMLKPEDTGIVSSGNGGNDGDHYYLHHPYYDVLAVPLW